MKQIIVVTGAYCGFGRMSALELAMAGHTVYAGIRETAGRNAPQVATSDAFAAENRVDLHAIEIDVVSQESIDAAIEKVLSEQGRIDGVVNYAGHMTFGPSEAFIMCRSLPRRIHCRLFWYRDEPRKCV